MEKPDNVADNPGILPYGSNIGALRKKYTISITENKAV